MEEQASDQVLEDAHWLDEDSFPGVPMVRPKGGKKAAGRTLDGREWSEMPREVSHA